MPPAQQTDKPTECVHFPQGESAKSKQDGPRKRRYNNDGRPGKRVYSGKIAYDRLDKWGHKAAQTGAVVSERTKKSQTSNYKLGTQNRQAWAGPYV